MELQRDQIARLYTRCEVIHQAIHNFGMRVISDNKTAIIQLRLLASHTCSKISLFGTNFFLNLRLYNVSNVGLWHKIVKC